MKRNLKNLNRLVEILKYSCQLAEIIILLINEMNEL